MPPSGHYVRDTQETVPQRPVPRSSRELPLPPAVQGEVFYVAKAPSDGASETAGTAQEVTKFMSSIIVTRSCTSGSSRLAPLRSHFAIQEMLTFFPLYNTSVRMSSTLQGKHSQMQPPKRRPIPWRVKVLRWVPLAFPMKQRSQISWMEGTNFKRCVTFRMLLMLHRLWRSAAGAVRHVTQWPLNHGNGNARVE